MRKMAANRWPIWSGWRSCSGSGPDPAVRKPKYDSQSWISDPFSLSRGCHQTTLSGLFAKDPGRTFALVDPTIISVIDDDVSVRAATQQPHKIARIHRPYVSIGRAFCVVAHNDTASVIADVRMPAMSGIELQSHLRGQGHRLPLFPSPLSR